MGVLKKQHLISMARRNNCKPRTRAGKLEMALPGFAWSVFISIYTGHDFVTIFYCDTAYTAITAARLQLALEFRADCP